MEEQQKLNDIEILTIDREQTAKKIRVLHGNVSVYCRLRGLIIATVLPLLNGRTTYCSKPDSEYQKILRQFQADGVLVEQIELKEAA